MLSMWCWKLEETLFENLLSPVSSFFTIVSVLACQKNKHVNEKLIFTVHYAMLDKTRKTFPFCFICSMKLSINDQWQSLLKNAHTPLDYREILRWNAMHFIAAFIKANLHGSTKIETIFCVLDSPGNYICATVYRISLKINWSKDLTRSRV